MASPVITANNLAKTYRLYQSPIDRLKESIHPLRKIYHHDYFALKNISFELMEGETLGVIGKNGSGKSTLLKILTGVLTPSEGSVSVRGKVSALLELGAGFNPELTGIENIYFSGTIMGYSQSETENKLDDILSFADIGEYIYQPVKMYSSGMFVRLAFAVATSIIPDVLIVDEALSVGDIFFVQKCHDRMKKLMDGGATVILVSHDMQAIEKYCSHVLLLERGEPVFWGHPNEAILRYHALHCSSDTRCSSNTVPMVSSDSSESIYFDRFVDWPQENEGVFLDISKAVCIGQNDIVKCTRFAMCNADGQRNTSFEVGSRVVFFSEYEVTKDIDTPIGGIVLINKYNVTVHAKNSLNFSVPAPQRVSAGTRIRFRQEVRLDIAPDEYTFIGVFGTIPYQYYINSSNLDHAALTAHLQGLLRVTEIGSFIVYSRKSLSFYGYADLPGDCSLSIQKAISND